jgi:hypothetical protein
MLTNHMKLFLAGVLTLIGVTAVPASAAAAMYQYVSYEGNVRVVEAGSAQLVLQTAPDIALHSGVLLLDEGYIEVPRSMDVNVTGIPANM